MKVLVVVDMQNDFITGSLGNPEAKAIVPKVKKKIEEAVKNGDLIVYTRDTHFENYLDTREGKKLPVKHCICYSKGWRIPDELLPPSDYENYNILDKFTFGSSELPVLLHEDGVALSCNEIELIGLMTDICVVSNALLLKAAFYEGMEISVDASCCAGSTYKNHEAALKVIKACQINIKNDLEYNPVVFDDDFM